MMPKIMSSTRDAYWEGDIPVTENPTKVVLVAVTDSEKGKQDAGVWAGKKRLGFFEHPGDVEGWGTPSYYARLAQFITGLLGQSDWIAHYSS